MSGKKILLSLYLITLLALPLSFINVGSVSSLSGSQFQAGRIMDNGVFFNPNTANATQIQNFLNSKVPACDTNGTKPHGGTTRAAYGSSKGYPPPYTCLKNYVQSTSNRAADKYCGYYAGGSKSAARIINDVAKACGINPLVLVVLLEKEQSLITDDWPWSVQYQKATGFGCPDTAPCDSQFGAFFDQIYYAARQFKRYSQDSHLFSHRANRDNYVRWHPNAACGGTNVYLQNQATAGLYNYTPYRPNAAALNNLYGTGDGCSAYGNRNFWRIYNDWFGSTHLVTLPGCNEATNTALTCVWRLRDMSGRRLQLTSVAERNQLVNSGGYAFEGTSFFGHVNIAPKPGNIAVHRLVSPAGTNLLTTNSTERNSLVTNGWQNKGVDFYADPSGSNSGYPVYRLYSSSLGSHVWTTNTTDRANLIAAGYTSEGTAFTAISSVRQEKAPPSGKYLVYRFSGMPGNSHFWTTAVGERDSMIRAGYRYEGVAWHSSVSSTSVPVYRLYSPSMRKHLYTTSAHEKNTLSNTSSWKYEGVSQYMSPSPTSKPIYRLYSPITTQHLWTSDKYEHDALVRKGTFRSEGVAWYQP